MWSKMKRISYAVLFFFSIDLVVTLCQAKDPTTSSSTLLFEVNTDDYFYDMAVDNQFVWLIANANQNGVCKSAQLSCVIKRTLNGSVALFANLDKRLANTVTLDGQGNAWITTWDGGQGASVIKVDRNTGQKQTQLTQNAGLVPYGGAFLTGLFLFSNSFNNTLIAIGGPGDASIVLSLPPGKSEVSNVVTDQASSRIWIVTSKPSSTLIIADIPKSTIHTVQNNTKGRSFFSGDIALDNDGNAWVGTDIDIFQISPDGVELRRLASVTTDIFRAGGHGRIAVDGLGNVYVVGFLIDGISDSLFLFRKDENFSSVTAIFNSNSTLTDPQSLAILTANQATENQVLILQTVNGVNQLTLLFDFIVTGNPNGFGGFVAIFVLAVLGMFAWALYELQIARENRLYVNPLRQTNRLVFRLKNPRSKPLPPTVSSSVKTLLLAETISSIELLNNSVFLIHRQEQILKKVTLTNMQPIHEQIKQAVWIFRISALAFFMDSHFSSKDNEQQQQQPQPQSSLSLEENDQIGNRGTSVAADHFALTNGEATTIPSEPSSSSSLQKSSFTQLIQGNSVQPNSTNGKARNDLLSAFEHLNTFMEGTNDDRVREPFLQAAVEKMFDACGQLSPNTMDNERNVLSIVHSLKYDEVHLWGYGSEKLEQLEKTVQSLIPRFLENATSQNNNTNRQSSRYCYSLNRIRNHPWFYGLFFFFIVTIFLAFAGKTNRTTAGMQQNGRPGGYGQTFLPVPPQYSLDQRAPQADWVPVLYGVMHCVLFFLGLLPIPFMRGFWRDVVAKFPRIRRFIPIDDFGFVHRLFGLLSLCFLLLACLIWLITMGSECFANGVVTACKAFDASDSNPVDNVLILRFIVWCLWFPIMPAMYFVRKGPPFFIPSVTLKRWWFEIWSNLHVFVALLTVLLALICRFTVFYPVLLSWIPYILDWIRESILNTVQFKLGNQTRWFANSKDGRPTSIRLVLEPKLSIETDKPTRFKAGQWVYVKIPSIDRFHYHPFSVAGSTPASLELHVGIIVSPLTNTKQEDWRIKPQAQSWTYKLWNSLLVQNVSDPLTSTTENLDVLVRGPYGSAFVSCFDPQFNGAVVIGAGTGLTAAESVLKELTLRKSNHIACPQFVWFVWSCRSVDDLLWCWDTLCNLVLSAIEGAGTIKPPFWFQSGGGGSEYSECCDMLDWLGISIYVTQATEKEMKVFLDLRKQLEESEMQTRTDDNEDAAREKALIRKQVYEWMKKQILEGSLDEQETHISKLLHSVRCKLSQRGTRGTKLTVCFCGPSTLAATVQTAAISLGHHVEFSADAQ